MWNSIVFCTLLVLTMPHVDAKSKKTKSVTTLLDAKWNVTPLVLEVAEYLADENIDYFWSFIDSISALDPPLAEIENDRDRYEKVLTETSKILSPAEISVLKFGLSLHVYSPKVEMFERIAIDRNLKDCRTVADVGGQTACGVEEMKTIVGKTPSGGVETFKIDHHYPGSENNTLKVVLYGEIGDPEFSRFHRELVALALSGKVNYVVRHFVKDRRDKRLRLSGYGVELQMKSTEYKAQDDTQIKREESSVETSQEDEDEEIEGFNFSRLKNLYPDRKTVLNKFRQHLVESSSELTPLKVWQFQELSLQAAERIMRAPHEEALHTLTHIAQNFPTQAKSLVRTVVDPKLKNEIKLNQDLFASTLNLQPSDTALFINGMFFDLDVVDVVSLLEVIRREQRVMHGLHRAGIVDKKLQALLTVDLNDNGAGGVQEFAVDIRDSAVIWVNDIETDAKYRHWSSSLMELLRPTFPGMLRSVRKNLYNLVLIIDPADLEAKPLLKLLESFYVHTAPLRLGLVFAVDDKPETTGSNDPGVALLCAYNYVAQLKDSGHALGFITDVYAAVKDDRPITVDDVIATLRKEYPKSDPDEILGEDSDFDFGRRLASDFIRRTGLSSPAALFNGVSLAKNQLNADEFEEAVLTEVMQQTPVFQKAIYRGEFSDSKSAIDFIMDRPNVMPRLNQRVLDQRASDFIDTSGRSIDIEDVPALLKASNRDMTATAVRHLKYFRSAKNVDKPHTLTYWIVGDLNCEKSRELLLAALKYTKGNSDTRVTFLPNVEQSPGNRHLLNKLVLATLDVLPLDRATQFMISILEDTSTVDTTKYPADIRSAIPEQDIKLKMLRVYCQRVFSFGVGKRGVVVNGRVLGPFDDDERFDSEDFLLLERHAMSTYGDKITKALKAVEDDVEEITSDQLLRAIPLLISRSQSRSRFEITYAGAEHSVVTLPAMKPDEPTFELTAIVDPVSRGAQKLGPILGVLQSILNCNVRVFLNCVEKNSDMPLKSFYRFVLEPEIQFLDDGRQSPGPTARFSGLPTAPLLTQNMLVPENWLVAVVRAVHDLDNIRLEDVDSAVHSEYELEYLLLEGHCFEATSGTPPRGLQITLGTESNPIQVDTIVMANLGYFQLKANPGAWILRLRQGRSADIYDIVSHDGSDTPAGSTDIKVLISSLRSHVLKLKVSKKPEMRHVDLLAEDEPSSGIWNSITSQFGGTIDEDAEEKINIFSLASGHLYERFLRIMMLSVLKNTKSPVKFWFLKNYLSPQFKDFLPHMAAEYGFDYELVEYKWPRWLHQQTEKQRIIWGYKILFLDVLFPLDIKKIIFVDADQVVRADMKELQRLDLGGAPYGYTPFCESRVEMDGFRFWKQGYWRNHLQGRRYHISALYVVDLKRFRRIAAGDRLRGQYQALSQDPNSLANLDQDLPNNMIHQVAIKSLPQEWLWCETWCDDASKKKAKTIDLCNNPMTKEAKLSAAVRIVDEWKDYDEEIRILQRKVKTGGAAVPMTPTEKGQLVDVHIEL